MALTKVSGHIIDQPFDVGIITATNSYVSGIGTFGNIRVLGDIQVDGATTTLDTVVTEVDRLEVGANNSTVGVAITQSGSGDIFNLYDGSTEVFSVADGGTATFASRVNVGANNLNNRAVNAINASTTVGSVSANNHNANGILFQGYNASVDPNLASFVVQSNGSTGIGTHTPTAKLDIEGTLRVGTSGLANGGTNIHGQLIVDRTGVSGSNPWLSINTSGSTVFYVNGGGSVVANGGVNATSFTAGTSGTGNGNSSIFGSLTVDRNGVSGSNTWFQVKNGTTPIIYANGQGKVGIGTDNPGSSLHVLSSSYPTATITRDHAVNYPRLRLINTANDGADLDGIGDGTGGFRISTVDAGTSTERLRVTSGGDVGIGDNAPNSNYGTNLSVHSTATDGARLKLSDGTTGKGNTDGFDLISTGGVAYILNRENADMSFSTNNTERLRITAAGLVRVPDNGKITFGASDDLQIYHDGSNSYINEAGTGQLRILSNRTLIKNAANSVTIAEFTTSDNSVILYKGGSAKLQTTTTGAKVTGALEVTQEYPSIRPILDLNFAATKTLDRRITFTRDSLGTYYGENGLVKYASNNVPRFDHDPTTGESLGLLIEEARTNLVEYGDFTTGWTEYGGTATSTTETAAPDGTFTAKKITSKGDQSTAGIYDSIQYSANTTYTHTMWLKAGSVTIAGITVNSGGKWASSNYPYITVNLSTGAVTASGGVSAKATAYPNGWYRLEATGTFAGNTQVDAIWVHSQTGSSMSGNTTGYYYVWGPQAEQGAFATSYIPTSRSTVTRAQDTPLITGTNFTDFYNQSEGTLVLSADIGYTATSNQAAVAFEDTSNVSATFIAMGYNTGGGGSGTAGAWYNNSGTTSAFAAHNTGITINTEFKQAYAYKLNDFSSVANGSTPLTDNSGTLSTSIDRVRFGIYHYDGMTSGHIRQFKYYNKRLPNAQLQGLTQQ